jgi:acylglycerol lipase
VKWIDSFSYRLMFSQAVAPLFSVLLPRYQFRGANRKLAVCRDPAALVTKYTDPLVYTGPIRVRTGTEILRLSYYLLKNLKTVTVPFLVLHGSDDQVTDPKGSQELYDQASSMHKDIKLYTGLLHDILFEPERFEITEDILKWMDERLGQVGECEDPLTNV